ncbi:MAG TPA: bile acid:sodium symporter family protein [Dermatophilaceae bacterium]|nr:bile acid:sodium symporter family protein [Dermatophilaceae bacterium]
MTGPLAGLALGLPAHASTTFSSAVSSRVAVGDVDDVVLQFNSGSLDLLRYVIAAILFGIALDTKVSDFSRALRKPKAMAVAIVAQFLLLPALTFALTLLLQVRGSVALGMILVACCPPGNVSNILTHRAGGDVALSVSMTAVSNVFAIFLMPLNVALWAGLHPTAGAAFREFELSAVSMLGEIALVIGLPFALGIFISSRFPTAAARAQPWVSRIAVLALVAFIVAGVAGNSQVFLDHIGVVLLAVLLHDAVALGLGYAIARASGLDEYSTKAMTFEVGIRNAGLGLLIVFAFFGGLGGMAIVAAWWGVWDIIAGLAVAAWWTRRATSRELAAA